LRLALSKGLNRVDVSSSPEDGNDPVSESLCCLVCRIPDDGKSPENPVILRLHLGVYFFSTYDFEAINEATEGFN
jgi:hypothetical protein